MRYGYKTIAVVLPLWAALFVGLRAAHATSVQQFDLARLYAESALVVRAQVLEGSGYARDMGGAGVCTDLRLSVLEVFAGQWDRADNLVFCLPGGVTPDGKIQMVLGAPMPREGDTYVLFIKGGDWSYTPFVNWFYGALREEVVQGQNVLVAANGDCIANADSAFVEFGTRVSSEDQVRHLSALGVNVGEIMSPGTSQGALTVAGSSPGQSRSSVRFERSTQCAASSVILDALRRRGRARASTSSLLGTAPVVLQTFHTPLPTSRF